MKSYNTYLATSKSYGTVQDLNKKPVYKGSALFPFIENLHQHTRILFMGYWMVKNNIDKLALLITLRDNNGEIFYRETQEIDTPNAREIKIKDLVNFKNKDITGSIELEVFSIQDLVFPYPAFVVNYYTKNNSSFVHTCGRAYNDVEDYEGNSIIKVKEAGVDVYGGKDVEPFIFFTNGPKKKNKSKIKIEVINFFNKSDSFIIDLKSLNPYETIKLQLNKYFDFSSFLKDKPGTIKIKHDFESFFPRFISGNYSLKNKSLSVTHTYYDNSKFDTPDFYWKNPNPKKLEDSALFFPAFVSKKNYTKLKFYPIYSPSDYSLNLIVYDSNGNELGNFENIKSIKKKSQYFEIDAEDYVKDFKRELFLIKLVKNFKNKSLISNRLKYGLNVGEKNNSINLPTNICFNSHLSNEKLLSKPGTFKWFPIINHNKFVAFIYNCSFEKLYERKANCLISIYKETSSKPLTRKVSVNPNGFYKIEIDDIIRDFIKSESAWVTIKTDNPMINGFYFDFSNKGLVGGDHFF